MKGSDPKVVIVEDLTRSNYQLFLRASEHPGTLRAWSKDGKIFVQSLDIKIFKTEKLTNLSKLSFDVLGFLVLYPCLYTDALPFGTINGLICSNLGH